VPKDWEMVLGVVGDVFFLILPKIVDWEVVSGTVGDALIAYNDNAIVVCLPQGSTAQHIMTAVF
jgi:hypothetical protein